MTDVDAVDFNGGEIGRGNQAVIPIPIIPPSYYTSSLFGLPDETFKLTSTTNLWEKNCDTYEVF